jgi:hypothetical protein
MDQYENMFSVKNIIIEEIKLTKYIMKEAFLRKERIEKL